MKPTVAPLLASVAAILGCATPALAQIVSQRQHAVVAAAGDPPDPSTWFRGSPVQSQYVVGADGNTYIGFWIDAPTVGSQRARPPMDVALVVDTSGSMSGDKIVQARLAATSFVESLADGDIVSIYGFGSSAYQVAPPTVVGGGGRSALISAINSLQASGGTNMYDGLNMGELSAGSAPGTHPVRRLVMISDGQANIGPATPEALGDVAGRGTENGVQISAIGVGMDYDERTLGALATRSAGRLYHLSDPSQMATILHNELNLLGSTVAANAYIEVVPAPGVEILGVEALPMSRGNGNAVRIPIGALHGGQHREVLVRARVDTAQAGQRSLATARFVFNDPRGRNAERSAQVALGYGVVRDRAAATASAQPRVSAMVARFGAATQQLQATEYLNRGQLAQADAVLGTAEQSLRTAASSADDRRERERLESQAQAIATTRARARSAEARPASPGGAPAPAARGAALQNNADAYRAFGM